MFLCNVYRYMYDMAKQAYTCGMLVQHVWKRYALVSCMKDQTELNWTGLD